MRVLLNSKGFIDCVQETGFIANSFGGANVIEIWYPYDLNNPVSSASISFKRSDDVIIDELYLPFIVTENNDYYVFRYEIQENDGVLAINGPLEMSCKFYCSGDNEVNKIIASVTFVTNVYATIQNDQDYDIVASKINNAMNVMGTQVNEMWKVINEKIDKDSLATKTDLNDTENDLKNEINNSVNQLASKIYTKDDTYSKSEIDSKYVTIEAINNQLSEQLNNVQRVFAFKTIEEFKLSVKKELVNIDGVTGYRITHIDNVSIGPQHLKSEILIEQEEVPDYWLSKLQVVIDHTIPEADIWLLFFKVQEGKKQFIAISDEDIDNLFI